MRILFITAGVHPVPPVKGGAVENLTDFILKSNHEDEIDVYSIYDREAVEKSSKYVNVNFNFIKCFGIMNNIYKYIEKVFRRVFKIYTGNYYIKQVCRNIKKSKKSYDFIIIENMPQFGLVLKKKTNDKLILHLHNDYLNTMSFKANSICECYNKILCVSNFITNRVIKINEKNQNIITLYNGIDLKSFSVISSPNEIFKKYGIDNTKRIFIYSGRVVKEKGVKELIEAFIELGLKDYQLLIAGSYNYGKENDNSFIIELKKVALNGNVIFTGYIPYEEMVELYSISSFGVIPSIVNEACPLTAIEMMACELPIICTNSGGLPELVNEKCGIIVERKDLKENLKNAIKRISLLPEEEIKKYKNEALKKSKEFSKEKYIENFWKIIHKTGGEINEN